MPKRSRAKLVPQITRPSGNQGFEALAKPSLPEQKEELALTELDHEIECPRCNDVMELNSSFDALAYYCENCSFFLRYYELKNQLTDDVNTSRLVDFANRLYYDTHGGAQLAGFGACERCVPDELKDVQISVTNV